MRRRLLVAIALVIALFGIRAATVKVPRAANGTRAVHGAYHVHSNRSDGNGSPKEIARAAHALGLDFVVLSDHNVLAPELGGVHDGVLIIPATEESTSHGHVVSLGASRALQPNEKNDEASPLASIRALGGVPMLAHPYNRRNPFTDWREVQLAAGLETLSYDDLWREALHAPLSRGLVVGALELPFNPRLAVAQLIRRPRTELLAFDELRKTQPIAQLCSVDAHGTPSYGSVLGTMSMYLDDVPPGALDPKLVLERLEQGRAYCGLDVIAPAGGFVFRADGSGTSVPEGGSLPAAGATLTVQVPAVDPALQAEIHLFRDGSEIAVERGPTLRVPVPGPGDYRVEVWAPLPSLIGDGPQVPWILSNPIRLQ